MPLTLPVLANEIKRKFKWTLYRFCGTMFYEGKRIHSLEGPLFRIEWYFSKAGSSPALEYYKSLDADQRKKFLFLLKRMGDFGKINDETKFRYEGEQIYALKPQPEGFLCFFIQKGKIVITNGFRKKQQKLPKGEKERALMYKDDYQKRTKEGSYYES